MTQPTDSAVLSRNLAALAAQGVFLPDAPAEGPDVRLEARAPEPVLSLHTADGRWVRMHSQRDPIAEADRLVAPAFESAEPNLIIVIGLGLGYVLDAVERRSSRTKVLALEPVQASLTHLLSRRDWSAWLAEKRLRVLVAPGYAGASDAWRAFDADASMPPIIIHPVLTREAGADVVQAREVVEKIAFGALANLEARKQFAGRYLLNTLKNLPVIAREGNAGALFDRFSGVPAIITSAGPSLDRNIPILRRFHDRALVITVDTALRPLLGAGIDPHLVVAVDPSVSNARHLVNLPDTGQTWFVAEGSLDPVVFRPFEGRTVIYKVSNHHPWPWLRGLGIERDTLRVWGSVATSAFDLALKMGCDPIIFAGQDLAYTGGQPYCRGTTVEEAWAALVGAGDELPAIWERGLGYGDIRTMDDISGQSIVTTAQLVAFRDWIADQAAVLDGRTVINATGGGILYGPGIRQDALESVLAALPPLRELHERVRESWSQTRNGVPAEARRTGPQLLAAFKQARGGEELTTWASFANTTTSALAAELEDVATVVEGPLADERDETASADPAPSWGPASAGPSVSVVGAGFSRPESVRGPALDVSGRLKPAPTSSFQPERVRVYRALLLEEPVPEWAQCAVGTIDRGDATALRKALGGIPHSALIALAERCLAASAFSHAAPLFMGVAEKWRHERGDSDAALAATIQSLRCLFLAGDFEAAVRLVDSEALVPLPEDGSDGVQADAFPVLCLSIICQLVGDHEQMVPKVEGLLAAYPDLPDLRLNLAARYAMHGNLQGALDIIDVDAAMWPGRMLPDYVRGVCRRVHGDYAAAIEGLSAMVDGGWPYAAPELLVASVATQQNDETQRALRAIRESLPDGVAFLNVPAGQEVVIDTTLALIAEELAKERRHVNVSRLSPIAVRMFIQAADAWKPGWSPG